MSSNLIETLEGRALFSVTDLVIDPVVVRRTAAEASQPQQHVERDSGYQRQAGGSNQVLVALLLP
jgi:hypothetical protein